jgi:subtilisin-like proprotein convertase family protein
MYVCGAGFAAANGEYESRGSWNGSPQFYNSNGINLWKYTVPSDGKSYWVVTKECAAATDSDLQIPSSVAAEPLKRLSVQIYSSSKVQVDQNGLEYVNQGPHLALAWTAHAAASSTVSPSPFLSNSPCASAPVGISDPGYVQQAWYLDSMKVPEVWAMGITGKNIKIRVNDFGVDATSPDLSNKFRHDLSLGDFTPMPVSSGVDPAILQHGTVSAGVSAGAKNGFCGVGVAYDAEVSASNINNHEEFATVFEISGEGEIPDVTNDISSNSFGVDACKHQSHVASYPWRLTCPFAHFLVDTDLWPCTNPICAKAWTTGDFTTECKDLISHYCGAQPDPGCAEVQDIFFSCNYNFLKFDVVNALSKATSLGREGLGEIFVFSASNEGHLGADVNLEGYLNSIYTIAVGTVDERFQAPSTSGQGAALMVVAPAGVHQQWPNILSCGLGNTCANGLYGTSYATPMVSGVIALMLEANPKLNWREVQDIIARTSQKVNPHDGGWITNGAGLHHSYKYGFGKINALHAVEEAQARLPQNRRLIEAAHSTECNACCGCKFYTTRNPDYIATDAITPEQCRVGECFGQHDSPFCWQAYANNADYGQACADVLAQAGDEHCSKHCRYTDPEYESWYQWNKMATCTALKVENKMVGEEATGVSGSIDITNDMCSHIEKLEHVEVYLTIEHSRRGDLKVDLISPSGVESVLVYEHNEMNRDFANWKFMTVRNWGESPAGQWTLKITDRVTGNPEVVGNWKNWKIVLHGECGTTYGEECHALHHATDTCEYLDVRSKAGTVTYQRQEKSYFQKPYYKALDNSNTFMYNLRFVPLEANYGTFSFKTDNWCIGPGTQKDDGHLQRPDQTDLCPLRSADTAYYPEKIQNMWDRRFNGVRSDEEEVVTITCGSADNIRTEGPETLCVGGQVWNQCGSPCTPTCDHPAPTCLAVCTERCECPSGHFWDVDTATCKDSCGNVETVGYVITQNTLAPTNSPTPAPPTNFPTNAPTSACAVPVHVCGAGTRAANGAYTGFETFNGACDLYNEAGYNMWRYASPTTGNKWWLITNHDSAGKMKWFYESAFVTVDALFPVVDLQNIWAPLASGKDSKLVVSSSPCPEYYVCGSGVERANGKYTTVGIFNDALDLTNEHGVSLWKYNEHAGGQAWWVISEFDADTESMLRYYASGYVSSDSHHPPVNGNTEWMQLSAGVVSTPMISTVDCETLATVGQETAAALRGATFQKTASWQIESASTSSQMLFEREQSTRAAAAIITVKEDAGPSKQQP